MQKIVIFDFGGQYAHLIASRIRKFNVYAEIRLPHEVDQDPSFFQDKNIRGIILSGGPQSVSSESSPTISKEIFEMGIPILGICYGHQLIGHMLGGKISPGSRKEYGQATLKILDSACPLFTDIKGDDTSTSVETCVWMNHSDTLSEIPSGFSCTGQTPVCQNAAIAHYEKQIFGIQFHPEVTHSESGQQVLQNFVDLCKVKTQWTTEHFLALQEEKLREKVGDKNIFLFVSGGVDSTVCLAFLTKIFGKDRVRGLFVDTGMLRQGEKEEVTQSLQNIGADLTVIDAADTFLSALEGLCDPEEKRMAIGNTFLDVQQQFFAENKLSDDWILGQGTIYPDTIETGNTLHADKIKTHHNRVEAIQRYIDEGKIVEPIAELYKDEVRELGSHLGLPHHLIQRHPFPGPGLGVRILCSEKSEYIEAKSFCLFTKDYDHTTCDFLQLPIKSVGVQGDNRTYAHPVILQAQFSEAQEIQKIAAIATDFINHNTNINRVILPLKKSAKYSTMSMKSSTVTRERIERLQRIDAIVQRHLFDENLYNSVWQFPVVLCPITFNNKGEDSIILRPVSSIDAMSADVPELSSRFFDKVVSEIEKHSDISEVFLDVTSKPPGTIEWE